MSEKLAVLHPKESKITYINPNKNMMEVSKVLIPVLKGFGTKFHYTDLPIFIQEPPNDNAPLLCGNKYGIQELCKKISTQQTSILKRIHKILSLK